jgi:hypothetical protein
LASLKATITDITKGPFNLWTLFQGGTILGVTLSPTTPTVPAAPASSLIVQSDPSNGGTSVTYGDVNITGTGPGLVLDAGSSLAKPLSPTWSVAAATIAKGYIQASANGAIVNVEVS